MHSSLAVTTDGISLGLSAIKFWSRDQFYGCNALKKRTNPTRVPIEVKESFRWLENLPVVNLDKLTYAGNLQNLASVERHPAYHFEQGDICDSTFLDRLLDRYQPRAILHFADESHVDRSLSLSFWA